MLFSGPWFNFLITRDVKSYCFGFFLFFGLIFSKSFNKERNGLLIKSLSQVATISYPLYLTHVLPGYVVIYFSLKYDFTIYYGILAALGISLFLAYVITYLERYIRYSQRITHILRSEIF